MNTTTLLMQNAPHQRRYLSSQNSNCSSNTIHVDDGMPTDTEGSEVVAYSKFGGP